MKPLLLIGLLAGWTVLTATDTVLSEDDVQIVIRAEDDDTQETFEWNALDGDEVNVQVNQEDGKPTIILQSLGKIMRIVDPDGEVQTEELNFDGDDDTDQELRKKLRLHFKGGKQKRNRTKVARLNQDGSFIVLDSLPDGINKIIGEALSNDKYDRTIKGQIQIIGPDGKQRKIHLDKVADTATIREDLKKVLDGADIDVEVDVQSEIDAAVKRLRRNRSRTPSRIRARVGEQGLENAQLEKITDKLDAILDRLKRLEDQVDELQDASN